MPETLLVEPDSTFIGDVIASGGADLKKCFQCATCTSVCTLSENEFNFPRRVMIAAQWGLKDRVLADPAIWLCHDCSDCTTNCPRGAKPSNVMGALRGQAIKAFSYPPFAGAMVSQSRYLAVLLLIPFLIFGIIALAGLRNGLSRPYVFAELFPAAILEPLFYFVSLLAVIGFAAGASRFVKALRASGVEGKVLQNLAPALGEIITHRRFSNCATNQERYWGHMFALFGFMGLAITGTSVGFGTMLGMMHTPLPFLSGWKLFANLCAGIVLVGTVLLIAERMKSPQKWNDTTYFDGFFLTTLAGVVATGILSELLRLAQSAALMYPVYFIHLVLIFSLFLYAPYSKFAHLLYRTIAMAATREKRLIAGALPAQPGAA